VFFEIRNDEAVITCNRGDLELLSVALASCPPTAAGTDDAKWWTAITATGALFEALALLVKSAPETP